MNKGEEPLGKFFVMSGDSTITFEFLKETYDKMAFLVLLFVKGNCALSIAARLNASSRVLSDYLCSERVRIISGICHNYFGF